MQQNRLEKLRLDFQNVKFCYPSSCNTNLPDIVLQLWLDIQIQDFQCILHSQNYSACHHESLPWLQTVGHIVRIYGYSRVYCCTFFVWPKLTTLAGLQIKQIEYLQE